MGECHKENDTLILIYYAYVYVVKASKMPYQNPHMMI
jgi:hypothetical protein